MLETLSITSCTQQVLSVAGRQGMCEEKYKFFNKLLNVIDKIFEVAVIPFLRWIRHFWQKQKYEKNKIEEMKQFIAELALAPAKLKQLDDIMNTPIQ